MYVHGSSRTPGLSCVSLEGVGGGLSQMLLLSLPFHSYPFVLFSNSLVLNCFYGNM